MASSLSQDRQGKWKLAIKHSKDGVIIPATFTYKGVPVSFDMTATKREIDTGWKTELGAYLDFYNEVTRDYTPVIQDGTKYIVHKPENITITPYHIDDDSGETPYLRTELHPSTVESGGGEVSLVIASNVPWEISDNAGYLSYSKTQGSNNDTITIQVPAYSDTGTDRTITIIVTGTNGLSGTQTITQKKASDGGTGVYKLNVTTNPHSSSYYNGNSGLYAYDSSTPSTSTNVDADMNPNKWGLVKKTYRGRILQSNLLVSETDDGVSEFWINPTKSPSQVETHRGTFGTLEIYGYAFRNSVVNNEQEVVYVIVTGETMNGNAVEKTVSTIPAVVAYIEWGYDAHDPIPDSGGTATLGINIKNIDVSTLTFSPISPEFSNFYFDPNDLESFVDLYYGGRYQKVRLQVTLTQNTTPQPGHDNHVKWFKATGVSTIDGSIIEETFSIWQELPESGGDDPGTDADYTLTITTNAYGSSGSYCPGLKGFFADSNLTSGTKDDLEIDPTSWAVTKKLYNQRTPEPVSLVVSNSVNNDCEFWICSERCGDVVEIHNSSDSRLNVHGYGFKNMVVNNSDHYALYITISATTMGGKHVSVTTMIPAQERSYISDGESEPYISPQTGGVVTHTFYYDNIDEDSIGFTSIASEISNIEIVELGKRYTDIAGGGTYYQGTLRVTLAENQTGMSDGYDGAAYKYFTITGTSILDDTEECTCRCTIIQEPYSYADFPYRSTYDLDTFTPDTSHGLLVIPLSGLNLDTSRFSYRFCEDGSSKSSPTYIAGDSLIETVIKEDGTVHNNEITYEEAMPISLVYGSTNINGNQVNGYYLTIENQSWKRYDTRNSSGNWLVELTFYDDMGHSWKNGLCMEQHYSDSTVTDITYRGYSYGWYS